MSSLRVDDWIASSQQYKTILYTDQQVTGEPWETNEAEEVILAVQIKPLSSFLDRVLMQQSELQALRAGDYLKDEWTEAFAGYDGRPLYVYRRNIQALMAYPNITPI